MAKDLYKTLGVRRNASADEIQKAYRELARKYHPDLNPADKTAKEKFQEIQSAYEVLNDSEKRQMYDRFGDAFETRGEQAGPNPFHDVDLNDLFGGHAGTGGFADLFQQFTQGAGASPRERPRAAPRQGRNLQHEVMVSFHTAVLGGEVPVGIMDPAGSQKTINVKIPAGISDGKKIRLRGQGERAHRRGRPGDLLVTVKVAAHPCYRRKGYDLELTVPITLLEAANGAKVDVPTPKGTIALSIPPNTSSGKRLRVRGMGVEAADGRRGDLFAEVQIVLPDKLSEESRALIKQIEQGRTSNPRAGLQW